jgi:cardiolipin synthase
MPKLLSSWMDQMNKLAHLVCELVQNIHYKKAAALADKASNLSAPEADQLDGYFGHQQTNQLLKPALCRWQFIGCSGPEFAALLRGAACATKLSMEHKSEELVWTGPDLGKIPVRRSEQVLLELISSAKESILIISFVLIKIPKIETALKEAILRGVDISLLLESEDKDSSESFQATCKRIKKSIPGLKVYVWPREKRLEMDGGFARVHAKCAVADNNKIFITSANLTSTALDKNMEMGVLINGGRLPIQATEQLISMIHQGEITLF